METVTNNYDHRLFSSGLRRRIHEARFHWLRNETAELSGSVIEIGCFNARSLDYLSFKPTAYLGLDAGWEGGLAEAIERFPEFDFMQSTDPSDISGTYDIGIALETLEHIPRPEALDQYLEKLACHAGILIATVPMEIGPLFALKFLYKRLFHRHRGDHSFREFIYQSFGLCDLVTQDNHRGFDYRALLRRMEQHFIIEKVEGIRNQLPKALNTQIGIRAKSRYI